MIRRSLAAAFAVLLLCVMGAHADEAGQGQVVLTLASQGSGPQVALGRVERKRPHTLINATATIHRIRRPTGKESLRIGA